jgi:hypothetical protein
MYRFFSHFGVLLPGPIADPLVRQAYVAAYDRRLRHPAWVSHLCYKDAYTGC